MIVKKIALLSISILLINAIFLFFVSDGLYDPTKIFDQHSRNVIAIEDCFNGIDDDGDELIDKDDVFDC
jgi:hypothetical protein